MANKEDVKKEFEKTESIVGEEFKRGGEEVLYALLARRVGNIVDLIANNSQVKGDVGVYFPLSEQDCDCIPTLSVKFSGKDASSVAKNVKELIKGTILGEAYMKPSHSDTMTSYSHRQNLLFNPEHNGQLILDSVSKISEEPREIKFDLQKLSKMSQEDFEKTMVSIQSKKAAIAKFVDENSTGVGRML
jgi:hypothetical protein